ncbi:bifunctional aminoglycoside phosphotransferase/ATP-binding protein [Gordonia paraffinivorans]|uniref:bifunctional aminoglycoside phosphotransferase/ATP-binding protein n=1 Tax=Gordonia paraffinivorans TaxID=175628 RepID=UPI00215A5FFA|nr:AAA family ATPase [Gordonia paraffinivorans]
MSVQSDPAGHDLSEHAQAIEVRETHSGIVVLCGDRALKAKKPVVTDFLDFGSVEKREEACRREVRLNRRLAPQAYLGVGHVCTPGEAPEPLVVMARLPEKYKLTNLLKASGPDGEEDVVAEIGRLAALIARFHHDADRGPEISRQGTSTAVWDRWQANLREIRELGPPERIGDLLDEIGVLAEEFIAGRDEIFDERIVEGRVVDGHGDLLAEDTFCMPDGPLVLDCLDFDSRLRSVDGVDDIAFLAMDIEYRGHRRLADLLVSAYLTEANDSAPRSLIDQYIAYRAIVRAKVDLIRATQGDADGAGRALSHALLARDHLRSAQVRLGLVGGLPGTGKSTVSRALADEVGAQLFSSDAVRHELRRAGALTGTAGDFGAGLYSAANTRIVYETLLSRARQHLIRGESVILDASWTDAEFRRLAHSVADSCHAATIEMRCVVDPQVAVRRIIERADAHHSDATPEIAAEMAARADEHWPDAVDIDTGGAVENAVESAMRHWRR